MSEIAQGYTPAPILKIDNPLTNNIQRYKKEVGKMASWPRTTKGSEGQGA
jgi:hypothetical protein